MRSSAVALAATLALVSLAADAAATPKPDPATRSRAVTKEVLDALAAEIDRSMKSLRIGGALDPYFIGYKVTEVEVRDVVASLGATTATRARQFVILEAHVHVGDYKFDNSNFVAPRRDHIDGIAQMALPLEPNPALAQRTAWLVTDAAYKEALEQFRAKQDALRTGASGGLSDVPSYSKEKPVVELAPALVPTKEPLDHMKQRAERLSATLRDHQHLRESRVAFTSFIERRWYLNSEGTRAHDTRRVSGVLVAATSQAEDGQELSRHYTHYGLTESDLPDDKALEATALELSKSLEALRSAPLIDAYTGPVLFEGEGAVGMVRYTLAQHLSGTPIPVGLSDQDSRRFGGALVQRIGLRVLSPLLSVTDDPTTHTFKKRRLIGGYRFDDEGVPAQRVQVIRDGNLESLLMSRTPSRHIARSNGHARLSMPGGVFRGSTTNLFVSGKGGLAPGALRKRLLAEAAREGLPYALVIQQFDDVVITSNPELSRPRLFQLLNSLDRDAPPMALLARRIYPDGREELVRGVQLAPVDMRAWRDVVAVGRDHTVRNYLNNTDDPFIFQLIRLGEEGFVPSAGIESAVVTPDLLFRELDVRASAAFRRDAPAVRRP